MAHAAEILAASLSPIGMRLTTFEVTFPRIILSEFNTHRMFSRNSASSRAIPVEKMIKRVMEDPYIPSSWGKNQKGMQAGEDVDPTAARYAKLEWLLARDDAVHRAQRLLDFGIHKQLTNRLLEPFMWHTVIVTATEWDNFFHLRNNAQAHPDIQIIARMMQELYEKHVPEKLAYDDWHLPLIGPEDTDAAFEANLQGGNSKDLQRLLAKVSVARCARVSYLTHDGKRDIQADLDLHDRLLESGHLSPFEHVARPATEDDAEIAAVRWADCAYTPGEGHSFDPRYEGWFGNLRGWVQYRKHIPNEHDILGART